MGLKKKQCHPATLTLFYDIKAKILKQNIKSTRVWQLSWIK